MAYSASGGIGPGPLPIDPGFQMRPIQSYQEVDPATQHIGLLKQTYASMRPEFQNTMNDLLMRHQMLSQMRTALSPQPPSELDGGYNWNTRGFDPEPTAHAPLTMPHGAPMQPYHPAIRQIPDIAHGVGNPAMRNSQSPFLAMRNALLAQTQSKMGQHQQALVERFMRGRGT